MTQRKTRRFKKVKFLRTAQEQARRDKLPLLAKGFKNIEFQLRAGARKGTLKFKEPLIENPRQLDRIRKSVRKEFGTAVIPL